MNSKPCETGCASGAMTALIISLSAKREDGLIVPNSFAFSETLLVRPGCQQKNNIPTLLSIRLPVIWFLQTSISLW
jgi:hypothetical protein